MVNVHWDSQCVSKHKNSSGDSVQLKALQQTFTNVLVSRSIFYIQTMIMAFWSQDLPYLKMER